MYHIPWYTAEKTLCTYSTFIMLLKELDGESNSWSPAHEARALALRYTGPGRVLCRLCYKVLISVFDEVIFLKWTRTVKFKQALDQFFIHFHKDLIHDNTQKYYFTLQTLIIYILYTISPLFYFRGHTLITFLSFFDQLSTLVSMFTILGLFAK